MNGWNHIPLKNGISGAWSNEKLNLMILIGPSNQTEPNKAA